MNTKSTHENALDSMTTLEKMNNKVESMEKELTKMDNELSKKDKEILKLKMKLKEHDIKVD